MTVKQAAEKLNVSEHTIRYYDRQGLMPFLKRDKSGKRIFSEDDICLMELIICLKNSHMSLSEIKKYIAYQISDDDTCVIRKKILENHKAFIKSQIKDLEKSLCSIDYKINNCIDNDCK